MFTLTVHVPQHSVSIVIGDTESVVVTGNATCAVVGSDRLITARLFGAANVAVATNNSASTNESLVSVFI